jgi:hypothetical protein
MPAEHYLHPLLGLRFDPLRATHVYPDGLTPEDMWIPNPEYTRRVYTPRSECAFCLEGICHQAIDPMDPSIVLHTLPPSDDMYGSCNIDIFTIG